MGSILQYLPIAIIGSVGGTTLITFYLSYVEYKHVTYFVPYISDTGTYPPESCIFGQALNIVSALIAFAIYLKSLQVEEILVKHNIGDEYNLNAKVTFMGYVASAGISIVANFQETNAFVFHLIGANMAFGGGAFYMIFQTYMYKKISLVIGQRKTTILRMILTVVSGVSFISCMVFMFVAFGEFKGEDVTKWKVEDGGYLAHEISAVSEWICATCTMVYIYLFHEEFKDITVTPSKITLDEQNKKDDRENNNI